MAGKTKKTYTCTECGAQFPKWAGQCGECNAWNSLVETVAEGAAATGRWVGYAGASAAAEISDLGSVAAGETPRISTGLGELDRVLGGGLVPGSVVLIGGDPGIGKSTLLLQVLAALRDVLPGLYVTGEESAAQVSQRARRLGLEPSGLKCLTETNVERMLSLAREQRPGFLVVDSIQTIYTELLQAAPGSVSQVRESAARLTRFAKEQGTAVFLVGHVTKEGGIAGPRVLEHMVDAVLYFEGDSGSRFRVLRAFKNRFGAVNELGVFAMGDRGLREVPNPSAIFLSGREKPTPGSAVMVTREGTRPLLVEVQALVDQSPMSNPRRVALGLEGARLAMLLAVLHRHGGVAIYDQDVFLNVVGGLRIQETAVDLPALLAVMSSFRNRSLSDKFVAFAEVGLAGELRPVPNGEERLREAASHGFRHAVVAKANAPKSGRYGELQVHGVERLSEAIDQALSLDNTE